MNQQDTSRRIQSALGGSDKEPQDCHMVTRDELRARILRLPLRMFMHVDDEREAELLRSICANAAAGEII